MSNFKPQLTIITEKTRRDYADSYGKKSPYQTVRYKTYRELKKNLKRHLEENIEDVICVIRSIRGEGGEWFENWRLGDEKPIKIKEGWM